MLIRESNRLSPFAAMPQKGAQVFARIRKDLPILLILSSAFPPPILKPFMLVPIPNPIPKPTMPMLILIG